MCAHASRAAFLGLHGHGIREHVKHALVACMGGVGMHSRVVRTLRSHPNSRPIIGVLGVIGVCIVIGVGICEHVKQAHVARMGGVGMGNLVECTPCSHPGSRPIIGVLGVLVRSLV